MLQHEKARLIEELTHIIRGEISRANTSPVSTDALSKRIDALEKDIKSIKATLKKVDSALDGK